MEVERKLSQLGLTLPKPPKPVAAYAPFVRVNDLLFLSGTTCYLDGEFMFTGRVGDVVTLDQAYRASQQAALNLLSVIKSAIGDLDKVKRIIKLNAYVNSAEGFDQQPQVANGASELLEELFGQRGKHARTAIGVSELPSQIPVEIELIVQVEAE